MKTSLNVSGTMDLNNGRIVFLTQWGAIEKTIVPTASTKTQKRAVSKFLFFKQFCTKYYLRPVYPGDNWFRILRSPSDNFLNTQELMISYVPITFVGNCSKLNHLWNNSFIITNSSLEHESTSPQFLLVSEGREERICDKIMYICFSIFNF